MLLWSTYYFETRESLNLMNIVFSCISTYRPIVNVVGKI